MKQIPKIGILYHRLRRFLVFSRIPGIQDVYFRNLFYFTDGIVALHKTAAMSAHSSGYVYRDYTRPNQLQQSCQFYQGATRLINSSLLAAASYFMQTCYDVLKYMSQAM